VLQIRDSPLDEFANAFLTYLCRAFRINQSTNIWRITVTLCDDKKWTKSIPSAIRERLDRATPVVLIYGVADDEIVSTDYHRFCMEAAGFAHNEVDALSPFDILIFIKTDQRIPNHEDLPYPALVIISHMVIHFAEFLLHRKIISESDPMHDYNDTAAVNILRKFIEQLGSVEAFLKLYRY
jgi:hypothetical protein